MTAKKLFLVFELALVCFLTGCNHVSGLDEQLIVYGLGVDKNDGEYEVTVQALNAQNTEDSNSNSSKKNVTTVSATGETLLAAVKQIENQSGKKILYSHAMILVISEDLAKSGVGETLRFFSTNHKLRPTVEVLISSTPAKEILSSENKFNAEDILATMRVGKEKDDGIKSQIRHVLGDLNSPSKSAKAWCLEYKDGEISCKNMAVFEDDKLKIVLDNEATKGALLLLGKAKNISDSVEVGDQKVFFELNEVKSKIRVDLQNDRPTFDIYLKVGLNLYDIDGANTSEAAKSAINERLSELVNKAITVCLKENNCDVFKFCRYVTNNYFDLLNENECRLEKGFSGTKVELSIITKCKAGTVAK